MRLRISEPTTSAFGRPARSRTTRKKTTPYRQSLQRAFENGQSTWGSGLTIAEPNGYFQFADYRNASRSHSNFGRLNAAASVSSQHNRDCITNVDSQWLSFDYQDVQYDFANNKDTDLQATLQEAQHARSTVARLLAREKKEKRCRNWVKLIDNTLLTAFQQFMMNTANLRNFEGLQPLTCRCAVVGTTISTYDVMCISFFDVQTLAMHDCVCGSVSLKLLQRGWFPCAPFRPTMAFDIRCLDMTRRIYLELMPNDTGFNDATEQFLKSMDFTIKTSSRRKFAQALKWYTHVKNLADKAVVDDMEKGRKSMLKAVEPTLPTLNLASEVNNPHMEVGGVEDHSTHNDVLESQSTDPRMATPSLTLLTRPSQYLRSRCALCFGGDFEFFPQSNDPHVIVCGDACFTQTREKNARDPHGRDAELHHPFSIFAPAEATLEMADLVEKLRPSKSTAAETPNPGEEDGFEHNMKLPRSVLNACEESFIAADEAREKTSTKRNADTGLMALLCRHDKVLWMVNMQTAGEKQFYFLTLLQLLFQHLPSWMRVGVLYDIGCQLHRSMEKWNFLPAYRDRITWAISIFHAYGHQWPCQLLYHPRKCCGFGLSDGEGCERCWSKLKKLIPNLRKCEFFRRLYILDGQISHNHEASTAKDGEWLIGKWTACEKLRDKANTSWRKVGIEVNTLKREWKAQIRSQTKPAPRVTNKLAHKAIDKLMLATDERDNLTRKIKSLELKIATSQLQGKSQMLQQWQVQKAEAEANFQAANAKVILYSAEIGAINTQKFYLKSLKESKFHSLWMKASAVKRKLRERLQSRRFFLERLERNYRATINEKNLIKHASGSAKKREPAVAALCSKYNGLCTEIANYIKQDHSDVPRGAVAPISIPKKGLWKLEVDDPIWVDVSLDPGEANDHFPNWLNHTPTRQGIRAVLSLERCQEETRRLEWETRSLQSAWLEDYLSIAQAIKMLMEDANTCLNNPGTLNHDADITINNLRAMLTRYIEHRARVFGLTKAFGRLLHRRRILEKDLRKTPWYNHEHWVIVEEQMTIDSKHHETWLLMADRRTMELRHALDRMGQMPQVISPVESEGWDEDEDEIYLDLDEDIGGEYPIATAELADNEYLSWRSGEDDVDGKECETGVDSDESTSEWSNDSSL